MAAAAALHLPALVANLLDRDGGGAAPSAIRFVVLVIAAAASAVNMRRSHRNLDRPAPTGASLGGH